MIGIAGGSCSGKTTLARKIHQHLGEECCHILFQDSFYIDQSDKFDFDGGAVNFDHPISLDFEFMEQLIMQLKSGQSVEVPVYDFATHKRKTETEYFKPKDVILVDGTLILSQENIRNLFDHSCFIECDHDTRLDRRLKRDVKERGRSESGVLEQFSSQVEPMHKDFVDPSRQFAQVVYSQEQLQKPNFLETLLASWNL